MNGDGGSESRTDGCSERTERGRPIQRAAWLSIPVNRRVLLAGTVAGLVGGAASTVPTGTPPLVWLVTGGACGVITTITTGGYVEGPGDGLVRGLGVGVFSWILVLAVLSALDGEMMMGLPVAFPLFVQMTLCVGAPAGVTVGLAKGTNAPRVRQVATGVVAGLVGGGVFAITPGGMGSFGVVARALGAETRLFGVVGHFTIAGVIGGLFGYLFAREARGAGSAIVLAAAYGLFWWLLGWLTLFPLLQSGTVAWSQAAAGSRLSGLVAHAVYGVLLGSIYAALNRIWQGLFRNPDPVEPGTGTFSVRLASAGVRGGAASLLGSLVFGAVLWSTGDLSTIAKLAGLSGRTGGLLIHALVGTAIGATYGILFGYEAPDLGAGVLWGVVYGVLWWLLGPLTLLPALIGNTVVWSGNAVAAAFPALVGHVLYGGITGTVFTLLERRAAAWAEVDPQVRAQERRCRRPFGTAAPSLWLFVLGMLVVIPVLL